MGQEIKKTIVKMGMDKTIQPKQFEPIKIQISIEESFCWETETQRESQMDVYRKRILNDFVTCWDEACVKIGEKNRCIGIVSNVNNKSFCSNEPEDEFTFD